MGYAKGLCMAIPNGFDTLFGVVSMRDITLPSHTAMWLKIPIFNILNMLYIFARANKYDYLCTTKVSYYGRKRTIRYRAHDNACPVCDEPYRGLVAWGQSGRSQISGRTSADLVVRQEPE